MQLDLNIWTVYDHPTDFPDCFVGRRHTARTGPTDDYVTGATAEEVAKKIQERERYVLDFMPRDPSDDPQIIGSWI